MGPALFWTEGEHPTLQAHLLTIAFGTHLCSSPPAPAFPVAAFCWSLAQTLTIPLWSPATATMCAQNPLLLT